MGRFFSGSGSIKNPLRKMQKSAYRYKIDPGTPTASVRNAIPIPLFMAEFTSNINTAKSVCDVFTLVAYSMFNHAGAAARKKSKTFLYLRFFKNIFRSYFFNQSKVRLQLQAIEIFFFSKIGRKKFKFFFQLI